MTTPANHWKLGLFVVVGVVLALGIVVFLGAESMHQETVAYATYFDESVQGLEVGSPVKVRGVTIGNVSAIEVAADRRHAAEVTSSITVKDLAEMGLAEGKGRKLHVQIPADVRAQLASQGITGVKFLQIDFFDPKDNPLPDLPFPVPAHYIPAAVSTMKSLEDAMVRAVNRDARGGRADAHDPRACRSSPRLTSISGSCAEKSAEVLAHVDKVLVGRRGHAGGAAHRGDLVGGARCRRRNEQDGRSPQRDARPRRR